MIQENYISFEQAKALKELGFPQNYYTKHVYLLENVEYNSVERRECRLHYEEQCQIGACIPNGSCYDRNGVSICNKPSLSIVQKWLREEKNVSLEPYRTACGWICMIVAIPSGTDKYQVGDDDDGDDELSGQFTTYEKALSAGIDKCIEILKETKE